MLATALEGFSVIKKIYPKTRATPGHRYLRAWAEGVIGWPDAVAKKMVEVPGFAQSHLSRDMEILWGAGRDLGLEYVTPYQNLCQIALEQGLALLPPRAAFELWDVYLQPPVDSQFSRSAATMIATEPVVVDGRPRLFKLIFAGGLLLLEGLHITPRDPIHPDCRFFFGRPL